MLTVRYALYPCLEYAFSSTGVGVSTLRGVTRHMHQTMLCLPQALFLHPLPRLLPVNVRFLCLRKCNIQDDVTELHCVNRFKTKAAGSEALPKEEQDLADTWVSVPREALSGLCPAEKAVSPHLTQSLRRPFPGIFTPLAGQRRARVQARPQSSISLYTRPHKKCTCVVHAPRLELLHVAQRWSVLDDGPGCCTACDTTCSACQIQAQECAPSASHNYHTCDSRHSATSMLSRESHS